MFTIEEIKAAHSKVKSGADFPNYIQDLIKLGVIYYETFVLNGHINYSGQNDYKIVSPPKYASLSIVQQSNSAQFKNRLKAHQEGKTDFLTFCKDCADSGIEKWAVCMDKMTCTYYDLAGHEVLVEKIPQ